MDAASECSAAVSLTSQHIDPPDPGHESSAYRSRFWTRVLRSTAAVDHGLEYSGRRSPRWAGERPCEIGDLLEQIHIIGDTTKQSPARILVQVIFLEQREKALATERHGRHRKLASGD